MFEGTLYSAVLEAKEKIDFASLQFPIYRKSKHDKEWYRFDSKKKMVSIRKNNVTGIGVACDIPEEVFVRLYSFIEECSKEEFDNLLKSVLDELVVA